jgi:hypothetical protein
MAALPGVVSNEPKEGLSRLSWWADVSARGTAFAVASV